MDISTTVLQLDWPWIAEWAYAGIFAVAVRIQNQEQFWISPCTTKNDVFGDFSEKPIAFQ